MTLALVASRTDVAIADIIVALSYGAGLWMFFVLPWWPWDWRGREKKKERRRA